MKTYCLEVRGDFYEEQDHIELLELLKTLPCNIILSGYPSALYDEHLAVLTAMMAVEAGSG